MHRKTYASRGRTRAEREKMRGGTDVPPRICQPINFKTSSNIFEGAAVSLKRMGL